MSAESGRVELARFDSDSLEMMRITAKKSGRDTHFYPMALATYSMLPPPVDVGGAALGEKRTVAFSPMHMAVGEEIRWEELDFKGVKDKNERAKKRAQCIHATVEQLYEKIGGYEQ